MNQYLLAVVLGIIEGVTEFLPISSTAHLRIAQFFLGLNLEDEFWKLFAIVIQMGAILSVVVLYWKKLWGLKLSFLRSLDTPRVLLRHPLSLVLVAFVTTAVPAFLLRKVIGHNLENLWVMVSALVVGGIVMWVVDSFCKNPRTNTLEAITLPQALGVGALQILSAVFPGTSRSMSTIAAGQLGGMSRAAALEFSFFLSIPTMFVACAYDLLKYRKEAGFSLSGEQVLVLLIGTVVSFVVAWAVVAWFLSWVKQRGFAPFAVYRIAIGCALAALLLTGKLG